MDNILALIFIIFVNYSFGWLSTRDMVKENPPNKKFLIFATFGGFLGMAIFVIGLSLYGMSIKVFADAKKRMKIIFGKSK